MRFVRSMRSMRHESMRSMLSMRSIHVYPFQPLCAFHALCVFYALYHGHGHGHGHGICILCVLRVLCYLRNVREKLRGSCPPLDLTNGHGHGHTVTGYLF